MKNRLLALVMVLTMVISLAACGKAKDSDEQDNDLYSNVDMTDLEYVLDKGTLVVGVSPFEPMIYMDENGKWTGFDAELAEGFAAYIGVEIRFVEIDWNNRIMELDSKSVDCLWCGMTLTDEVMNSLNTSNPYLNNSQVVVVRTEDADKYPDTASLQGLTFAVESGSSGQEMAEINNLSFVGLSDMTAAVDEVKSGNVDGAIIDSIMADTIIAGEGGSSELTYILPLNDEKYVVGFRKDSDMASTANTYFRSAYDDGTIDDIAAKYGVSAAVIPH